YVAQCDWVADAPIPRAFRAQDAGRSVVQREHDAEGHAVGAGNGTPARRPAADDRYGERISYGGARNGPGRPGFCHRIRSISANVGNCKMTKSIHPSGTVSEASSEQLLFMYRQM